jgi:hypothetical protein
VRDACDGLLLRLILQLNTVPRARRFTLHERIKRLSSKPRDESLFILREPQDERINWSVVQSG